MAGIVDTGRQFDDQTLSLLRDLLGQTLHGYTAYCPFDERNIYATARLDFGDHALDLSNRHEKIVLGPDYDEEDLAILTLQQSEGTPLWHPKGKQLTEVALGITVDDVLVVVDTMLLSKGSRRLNKLVLVQAIAFESSDLAGEDGAPQLLAFDRDIWSDEYLNVTRGPKISAVTRDHRGDYVVEPPYSYQFGRNIIRLSQPH